MIDWHCHILPGMDDGSHDVAESISMLEMQAADGIKTVVATPHFYANDESVESFLARRNESFNRLKIMCGDNLPEVVLGAEVRYYQGISRMADLKALRIEGSKTLLLEMPFSIWTEYMVRELVEISNNGGIKLVLAHIERYLNLQKRDVLKRVFDSDILIQANASFFSSLITKQKAISLLKEGKIHLLGTDAHNTTSRIPKIGKAFDVINNKLGRDYLSQMNEFGYSLLKINNI